MICRFCQLEVYGGHHAPAWCIDYVQPEAPAIEALPPKPQPRRGRIGTCSRRACYRPTVHGRVLCPACRRERASA